MQLAQLLLLRGINKEETNLLYEVATEKYYNDLANYILLKEYFTANPSGSLVIDKKISNVKEIVKIEINYENKINDVINLNTISNLITDNFNFIVPKIFQKISLILSKTLDEIKKSSIWQFEK